MTFLGGHLGMVVDRLLVAQASTYEKAKQNEIFGIRVCLRDNRSGERIPVDVARQLSRRLTLNPDTSSLPVLPFETAS